MPEGNSDPPQAPCYHLFSRGGIEVSQQLDPDLFMPRAWAACRRVARGSAPRTIRTLLRVWEGAGRDAGRIGWLVRWVPSPDGRPLQAVPGIAKVTRMPRRGAIRSNDLIQ